ncbi:hypothetical protein N8768_00865 [Flavobacteriaceae bacterium]|jgi:hypothetical protein|nr:hypothetical protein [Flavobacteriaceae bacterium]
MKFLFLTILISLTITTSCKKEVSQAIEMTQMDRVIAIHDDVMPKIGKIGQLINALESKTDSMDIDNPYNAAQNDLKEAYTYMMDWMKGFGERFDSDEILEGKLLSNEKKIWLTEEESKVNFMKKMVLSSINNAETLLKEMP